MVDDTVPCFGFPAVGRKKVTAAFDGGRLTSDGGVMLLSLAERRLGIAERLARLIPDRRDPTRITHSFADMIRARIFAIVSTHGVVWSDRGRVGAVEVQRGLARLAEG